MEKIALMWFRRDLRLKDNAALYHALRSGYKVLPLFIFDTVILDDLPRKADRRVEFILQSLDEMHLQLLSMQSGLEVRTGKPLPVIQTLVKDFDVAAVYTNTDYEGYARDRDQSVARWLKERGIAFHAYKDQVIFERDEVVKDNGEPYTVFTPYSRKWLDKLDAFQLKAYPVEKYFDALLSRPAAKLPKLEDIGFTPVGEPFPEKALSRTLLKNYPRDRDIPSIHGTSRLGVHLRFGTVSIRALATYAKQYGALYLKELIWREFYHMILWHFPHINAGKAFKKEYDAIAWRYDEVDFQRWCEGKTGYPLVDAGMRELNATGFMHNRVRMVTASFLAKHLLIDWRWGEAYFALQLLDYDFANNNGGWQWSAGSGCDAAPYFRVFNPTLQLKKFDPDLEYVKQWVPEYGTPDYPPPMVDHNEARARCLAAYSKALKKG